MNYRPNALKLMRLIYLEDYIPYLYLVYSTRDVCFIVGNHCAIDIVKNYDIGYAILSDGY